MTHIKKPKNRKIHFKYNFKEYLSFLSKYKALVIGVMFFSLIVEVSHVIPKFLVKEVVDQGIEFTSGAIANSVYTQLLLIVLGVYLGLVIARTIGNWLKLHLVHILEADLIYDLKKKYFNHIVHLSHNFHTTHKTGSLIARLGRGASSVERMTDILVFNVTPLVLQVIIVGISVIYFSFASFLVLLGIMALFIGYSIYIQNKQKDSNAMMNTSEDIEKANVADVFTNIDSIKYFGKEKHIKSKHSKLVRNSSNALYRFWNYFRWMDSGQTFILGIGTLALIYFPMISFLNGEITMGTVIFIYTIYGNIIGPMFGFVNGVRGYYRSMADFEDLFQYGKIKNDIKDKPGAENLKIKKGEIEFQNIKFGYHKNKMLFDNFNLKIHENEKVALVGHSGCGKTSLLKLLYRLYDVGTGSILIDKKDIKNFKQESLRGELSIVPQECVLFDDSIYNNIAFANPKASREEVFKAMKFAQLDKIVSEFPQKEKTIVGERGVKLSGGEKQRVSIARALLADKQVLVLDEATSALDSQTEHDIQKDLEKLMKGRTSIMIAHRLSTIMRADKIVVMSKGKIVQSGTHSELIKKQGPYKKMWNLQKGGYIK
jgi:ATP-binding cassette, subfamily B, heavy metal transporter